MTPEQSKKDLDYLVFYAIDASKSILELITVLNAFRSTYDNKAYRLFNHPVRKDIKKIKNWIDLIEKKIDTYEKDDKSDQGWY